MFKQNQFSATAARYLLPGAFALGVVLPAALVSHSVAAQQVSNQAVFSYAPRLTRSNATFKTINTPSEYQFTIQVPANAGAPLQAVRIVQDTSPETIAFDFGRINAYYGSGLSGGPAVPLASVGGEAPNNPGEATIAFNPPVQPGSTVTVSLPVSRNPQTSGVYLFGVTAYPAGSNANGIFLGYGRIQIYSNFD
jgi:hypothetical protein